MRSSPSSKLAAFLVAFGAFLSLPDALSLAGGGVRNGDVHDGRAVDCDVPETMRVRNTVGTDRMGLCVWATTQMMANYLNIDELSGLFVFMQTQKGGGWPERFDEIMARFAPGRKYRQYLGPDLDFIQDGIDSGRPVGVTYGYGELYGRQTIAHWVLCVALDREKAAILDNNDPGHIWWMSRDEFRRRATWPRGQLWAAYILAPPPPPVPSN